MKKVSFLLAIIAGMVMGCKKNEEPGLPCAGSYSIAASKFTADVPAKWYALAITLSRFTPGHSGPVIARSFGYMGLALYESVVPGIPDHRSIQGQLNELPALPKVACGEKYYYPACANAALANMVHHMFGNASPSQNFTIDSLENALNTLFKSAIPANVFERSVTFGQAISNAIYKWSTTDGGDQAYLHLFPSTYTPPVGPGLFVPQPGQFALLP